MPLFGSAYHVLTPPHLRELAAAFERRIGGAWRAYLSSVSDTMLRSIEDSRMRQGLQEQFARIEQAMEEELPVLGRGVAFFACRPLGLWRQIAVLLLPDGVHQGNAMAHRLFPRTAICRTGASPGTRSNRTMTSSSIALASAVRPATSTARSSQAAIRTKARARARIQTCRPGHRMKAGCSPTR